MRAGPPPDARPPVPTIPSSDINPVPASPSVSFEEARGFPSIPGYEVLEKIAEGGMGAVFRIRQKETGALRAAKTIKAGQADVEAIRRFRFEAEALAALHHPGICGIHAAGLTDGTPWFVMELIDGRELQELCDEPMEPRRAARIVAKISRAMAAAHALDILHRDLKPQNVFLCDDDEIRVADFGLARLQGGEGLTKTGDIIGTPAYMSPEQVIGKHDQVDARTDIWATGLILYRLLAGHSPWTQTNSIGVMSEIATGQLRPIGESCPDLEPELVAVLERALRFDIDQRYSSAADLADDLEAWLEDRTPRALALKAEEERRARRRRVTILTVLITLAIASVIATGFVVQRARSRRAATKLVTTLTEPGIEAQEQFRLALEGLETGEDLARRRTSLKATLGAMLSQLDAAFGDYEAHHLDHLEDLDRFRAARKRAEALRLTIDALGESAKVPRELRSSAGVRTVGGGRNGEAERWQRTLMDIGWIHRLAGRLSASDFLELTPETPKDPVVCRRQLRAICDLAKDGQDSDRSIAERLRWVLGFGGPQVEQRLEKLAGLAESDESRRRIGVLLLHVLDKDLREPGTAENSPDRQKVFDLLSRWHVELSLKLGKGELKSLAARAQPALDSVRARLVELRRYLTEYRTGADQRASHSLARGTLVEMPCLDFIRPETLSAPVELRAHIADRARKLLPAMRQLSVLIRHLTKDESAWPLLKSLFGDELDRPIRHYDPELTCALLDLADRVVGYRLTVKVKSLKTISEDGEDQNVVGFRWRRALIELDEPQEPDISRIRRDLKSSGDLLEGFLKGFSRPAVTDNTFHRLRSRTRTFAESCSAARVRVALLEGHWPDVDAIVRQAFPADPWARGRVEEAQFLLARALLYEARIAGPMFGGLDELDALRREILRRWREDQHCCLEIPGQPPRPLDLWTEEHVGNLWTPTWDQHHIGPLLIKLHRRRFELGLPMITTVPELDLSLMEASLNLYTTGKAVDEHLIRQARGHLELAELYDRLERPEKLIEHAGFALELSRGLASRPLQEIATRARDLVEARREALPESARDE